MSTDAQSNVFDDGIPKLLVSRIDYYAVHDPQRIYASMPINPGDLSQGFKDVSYVELARCVDKAAWWLDNVLGDKEEDRTPVFYSGPDDLQYATIFVAALKTRRVVFQCSYLAPNGESMVRMFDKAGCNVTISRSIKPASIVDEIHKIRKDMKHVTAPSIEEWLNGPPAEQYPYNHAYADISQKPAAIFHTSGTTSEPKLIPYTHQRLAMAAMAKELKPYHADIWVIPDTSKRFHSNAHFPHIGGLALGLLQAVYTDHVTVLARPADGRFSPRFITEVIRYGKVSAAMYFPVILQNVVADPEALEAIRSLDYVCTAGAMVPPEIVSKLQSGARRPQFASFMVSTEIWPTFNMEQFSPEYYGYHPLTGAKFEPVGSDNGDGPELFELTMVKALQDPAYQTVFQSFPDLDVWRTGDLFKPHPTRLNFWTFAGRADDMVTLSTGHNVYVGSIEKRVSNSPLVRRALVGQPGRPATVLLVEPSAEAEGMEDAAYIDAIWPYVEVANKDSKGKAVLIKTRIIVLKPSQTFVTTWKGSVSRKKTLELFDDQISALF